MKHVVIWIAPGEEPPTIEIKVYGEDSPGSDQGV